MWETQFHGRGGQGVVLASKILAAALFEEGLYPQAFPSYGAERRGAPVTAYHRADRVPVRMRGEMSGADHLILMDAPLLPLPPGFLKNFRQTGWIAVNSPSPPGDLGLGSFPRVATVDADRIAGSLGLGPRAFPLVNTAMLGAFARVSGLIPIASLRAALPQFISLQPESNLETIRQAYAAVRACSAGSREVDPCPRG